MQSRKTCVKCRTNGELWTDEEGISLRGGLPHPAAALHGLTALLCSIAAQYLGQEVIEKMEKNYWSAAARELKNSRSIAFAGLVAAFSVLLESMPIYIMGPTLKIYFSFLFTALGGWVYGPIMGAMTGGVVDTLSFLLAGYGEPYFPGFFLSAVLAGFFTGLLHYRRPVSLWRVVLLRVIVDFGVNVALGSVWKAMLYGKGYYYYLVSGLWKNALLLPVEVILIYLLLGFAQRQKLDKKYIHKS